MSHTSRDNSEQDVLNSVFDDETKTLKIRAYGTDGQNLQTLNASNLQIKTVTGGGYTYFCFAAPGTPVSTPKWQVFRLDDSLNLMFADGDALFNNSATDPTALSYTYG